MSTLNIYDVCELGRIDILEQWKKDGILPDLMDEDGSYSEWYPHEIAIRFGHLDLLKWLVNDSGQKVDLTVNNQRAVVNAAFFERPEILKWLVLESKQPATVRIDSNDTDWYKSAHHDNPEITSFLEAVNRLHVAGASIERLQQAPEMVQLVESGRLSPEIVSQLTDNDIQIATGAVAIQAPHQSAKRRL